jgi:hypothetical protein
MKPESEPPITPQDRELALLTLADGGRTVRAEHLDVRALADFLVDG